MRKHMKFTAVALALLLCLGLLSACSGTGEDESATTENVEETDTVTETEEPVVDETDEPEETDESDTTDDTADETTDETVEDELTVAEVMAINEDGSYSLTLYTLTEGAEAPTDYAAIDMTLYEPGTETTEYTLPDDILIYTVEDGTLTEADASAIAEGDMLAFYTDETGAECIAVYNQTAE